MESSCFCCSAAAVGNGRWMGTVGKALVGNHRIGADETSHAL